MRKHLCCILIGLYHFCYAQEFADPDSTCLINSIIFSGNEKTHEETIRRELAFTEGDTLSRHMLENLCLQSEEALMNTSLFNFVQIESSMAGDTVFIKMIERWYTWPIPFFTVEERNFNVWWQDRNLKKATYGVYITQENFRGRKETLKLLLKTGYNDLYGISYVKPGIDKKKNWGMSIVMAWQRNHELSYGTQDNQPLYIKTKDEFIKNNWYANASISYRLGLYNSFKITLAYDYFNFNDTIFILNPRFAPSNDYQFFSLNFQYKLDHRDYKSYPLKGYYLDFEINKSGFGLLKNETIKNSFIKSTSRKYFKINKNWHLALGGTFRVRLDNQNYYVTQQGLGDFNDFVRGYELYVVKARNFYIFRINLKRTVIDTKIIHLPLIKSRKFNTVPLALYFNAFFDAGNTTEHVFQTGNPLTNSWLYGYGIGVDFVTYYDKVWRIEYSMNQLGEKGLFLHFTAPI